MSEKKSGGFLSKIIWLVFGGAAVIGVVGALSGPGSGAAMNCLKTQDQYGNRRFGNTCSFPVVIRVCSKHKVSALSEGVLGARPKWQCQQAETQPQRMGVSIGWNSGLLSNANYVAGVCQSGYRVNVNPEAGSFSCSK